MSGLFSTFNVSKRGIFTQQHALQVSSHNVANANTEGYSRQRVDIKTTRPFCKPSMNSYIGPGQIGTGSEVVKIERVRDHFLDFQLRQATSDLGTSEYEDKYLGEVENVFNEPSEYGLSNMISKFFESWYSLSKQSESSNARTVLAQQSQALAKDINSTHVQLEKIKENLHAETNQQVFEVNSILDQLNDLNQQIISIKICKQEPNDLADKRDLLLDKLSKRMNISVSKERFDSLHLKPQNCDSLPTGGEELLVRKDPKDVVSRFSYIENIQVEKNQIKINYSMLGRKELPGKEIKIQCKDEKEAKQVSKEIDKYRILWANQSGQAYSDGKDVGFKDLESLKKDLGLFASEDYLSSNKSQGEIRGLITVQDKIQVYEDKLDKLAKGIAFSINAVHTGQIDATNKGPVDKKGEVINKMFFINKEDPDDDTGITAENITFNEELLTDVMKIQTGSKYDGTSGESDGNRALSIAQLQYTLLKFQDIKEDSTRKDFIQNMTGDGNGKGKLEVSDELCKALFIKGNVNGTKTDAYFKDTVDELGIQRASAKRIVQNKKTLLASIGETRDSVSGVSLDEEMTNLIQFQHCYQANAKMISVVDQLLDVVVNGLVR